MRAASPPWQIERENEMIVISHRPFGCGKLQADPAHEKVSSEDGKKSDEELGEQVGASFEKVTGKEKLHDLIHHGGEGREAA